MPRGSLAAFSVALCCSFFLELSALPVFGAEEPSYAPQPFACEVRYYFREQFRDAKPGEKSVSAPSFEREGLPTSHLLISRGLATRIVKGRVAHLPYQFSVKISRGNDSETGTLSVNVLDSSGKPLSGFPQVVQNPLSRTGDTSRKEFEVPISRALKKKIEKRVLVQDQFITHVDLIVGMDEDFLSGDFPK
jgi:hypothetical protein